MSESVVYQALRELIIQFTGADPDVVLKANPNRTPPPEVDDFMYMFILNQSRQSTNIHEIEDIYDGETYVESIETTSQPVRMPVQVDCFGSQALTWATIISTILRDYKGTEFLESRGVTCLFSDEAKDLTGVALGEEQYSNRWMVQAELQRIADLEIVTETFTDVQEPELIEIDSTYPPEEE